MSPNSPSGTSWIESRATFSTTVMMRRPLTNVSQLALWTDIVLIISFVDT